MKRLAILALAAGCSVVDEPYPLAWDPVRPAADCRRFEGSYADRGEAPGQTARPSLTREIFGASGPWEKAASVRFEFTSEDALAVTVSGPEGPPAVHGLSAKAGDFACERGKLVLRQRRWVASDLMSGRESVKVELHGADPYLVAHVQEFTTGVMFAVVPLSGESARWFRFPRLKP